MKKLSTKQKEHQIKHALYSFIRRKKRKQLTDKSYEKRVDRLASIKRRVISAPKIMNLDDNYEETVFFFNELRKFCQNRFLPFKIDFTPIISISASAALVLTAEIDRIMKTRAGKKTELSVRDFKRWDKSVQLQLRDMGMFDLLRTKKIPNDFWKEKSISAEHFLKFKSGTLVDGKGADMLNTLVSELTFSPKNKRLQIGLTEAMSNSIEHAYPPHYECDQNIKKHWWMSASFNEVEKVLSVMFYDEGIGIPKSLEKTIGENFSTLLGRFDEGKLIEAATQLSRTCTKEKNRGKGLKEIKQYIDDNGLDKSQLEIHSRRGYYKYSKDVITKQFIHPLEGTLIHWKVRIGERNYEN